MRKLCEQGQQFMLIAAKRNATDSVAPLMPDMPAFSRDDGDPSGRPKTLLGRSR